MELVNKQKVVYIVTLISNILFIIFTISAMFVYSGGTVMDHYSEGYVFFENFFSDLGRMRNFLGESNVASRVFFVSAMTLEGVSLFFYFILILPDFKEDKRTRILSTLGSISGVVGSFGFILLGFISLDFNDIAHGTLTFVAFIATLIALIFYTVVIFYDKSYPNFYAWVFIVCSILSLTYVVILFGGGSSGPLANLTLQSISQKIIVYVLIITFIIFSAGSIRLLNKKIKSQNITTLNVDQP